MAVRPAERGRRLMDEKGPSSADVSRVEEIFSAAIERAGPERAGLVEAACAGDAALAAHVRRLIAAHEGAGEFMGEPTLGAERGGMGNPLAEAPGTRIGPYKLLQ